MTTPKTKAILVSPGKENQPIQLHSPTIRALNSFKRTDMIDPDTSWDNNLYVRMTKINDPDSEATWMCERDRPKVRHEKLKEK